jgi:inner membrane protein
VAVAMVEVMRRLRAHPIQYLLMGCALSIFFLLLLSLSEHLSFALFGAGVAGLYDALYASARCCCLPCSLL